jgi:hypothetical protein
MIHRPESDPATPSIRQGERVQIQVQTTRYQDAGGAITVLPPGLCKRYEVRWSDKDFRLVER